MSFEIIRAPGVNAAWLLTIDSEPQLVDSLVGVEQRIAEAVRPYDERVTRTVYALGSREFHLDDGTILECRWESMIFDWRCADCQTDTDAIDEYYMVHDALWRQVAADFPQGHLCIGCLERRVGRELTAADFTAANVNSSMTLARSARLRDRLSRR
ncbi:hypothetical protein VST63_21550 [Mycolicibacterium sp. 050232]|uniref:hypothetical protein n=1 Tax=Mycolicibacterium sp. 050232 TaxID=3113982 RepID=UPI002E2DFDBD|nr:hypothetical protein [Mycolicibacterium sp. 050232]MED5814953.1 hypothetical protein [Mycolicibacterium sp. 050232]